ncbi:protease HtpX [Candidatus Purcelliella pentastirinorum]|uniref:protease HtpX n=1 Tax=Candidatus Purcelliella pentastirinorum TaxID=472834 RepID=UPI0023683CE6|nr:protease HtpX [Candidatus Purcelliella pentastirinorum]WDI79108.1 protease HtpX [Candidatus Purcelliella pentastirinorum]WDR80247.1 protease HtpX [Candidatus Purcelliella pentastirinorum]
MMRIILFIFANFMIMLVFGLFLSLFNITFNNFYFLILFSGIFGFLGSLISLFLSKRIALYFINGYIMKYPKNDLEDMLFKITYNQSNILGINMPQIVIYESCDINAFATGAFRNSSLIALSTALLEKLTEDEIEAVIGHEISHIYNGDMVTMVLLQGILNTFVIFFSRIFSYIISLLFVNNREDNDQFTIDNSLLYSIISFILEILFGVLASIIVMWFSRRREFYADANSAKLVGVDKMISALRSIKIFYNFSNVESSSIFQCLFIKSGKEDHWLNLFMTHPSLDKRINALLNSSYI